MFSDLDQRLHNAAADAARYQRLERRIGEMDAEQKAAGDTVRRLQAQTAKDEHDVERLEGVSLTALFYSILGSKEAQLEKERHEVLAAHLKLTETERRQASLGKELEDARRELAALVGARAWHEALLKQKQAAISGAAGAGARQIAQFGKREQQLHWQVQQLHEAQAAGQRADAALAVVDDSLGRADGWGT
jgi:chromosome segregation ATPase